MTVDIKLNQMVNELDERLYRIPLADVELSIRTENALRKLGARTLGDAQRLLINRRLQKSYGIGPKAVKEVIEIITNTSAILPPKELRDNERKLKQVLELFLSWTGALAVTGSVEPEAWRELIVIRSRAEEVLNREG